MGESSLLRPSEDCGTRAWAWFAWVKGMSVVSLAFAGMVVIQVFILLFKEFSQDDGGYDYNPASALAMAEFGKFCISVTLWLLTRDRLGPYLPDVPKELPYATIGLALLYAVNNQLTFVILTMTNAGTLALFKATTPTLVALLLWFIYGDKINKLQWAATLVQFAGLVLVADGMADSADDDDAGGADVNALLAASTVLTGLCSVWNSKALKHLDVPMPVLNIFLYTGGVVFNFMIYALRLAFSDQDNFFAGYADNKFAILVVFSNSIVGLAISTLFKYGDAIISRYASAVSAAVLLIIESLLLHQPLTKYTYIGAFVVLVASAIYLDIAINMPASPWPFDFPGAVAVARTLSSDDFSHQLKQIRSSDDLYAIIKESEDKLSKPRLPRRHKDDGDDGKPAAGKLAFRVAMANALTYVAVICATALVVCHLMGHRTLIMTWVLNTRR